MLSSFTPYLQEYYAYWLGLHRLYGTWAKAHHLSTYALYTLYAIWQSEKPISQTKICETWFMPKQTVCTITKEFTRKGYIATTIDQTDKRSSLLSFTEAGAAYAEPILTGLVAVEETAMAAMGDSAREAMAENNRRFLAHLQKEMEIQL